MALRATILAAAGLAALLGYDQMRVAACSHLCQMGYGQNLAVSAQRAHDAAYGIGHGAANARINFIKN